MRNIPGRSISTPQLTRYLASLMAARAGNITCNGEPLSVEEAANAFLPAFLRAGDARLIEAFGGPSALSLEIKSDPESFVGLCLPDDQHHLPVSVTLLSILDVIEEHRSEVGGLELWPMMQAWAALADEHEHAASSVPTMR
ncbi:hypothetical protein GE253_22850 [Niveispirillum sp. SYP-B3756]|uniref:hypothetical protein n=1 Tax=Niveispirillum sp. SYP-B3756 TaxID=2662178 RepID=UPI001290C673|nr:hypothetical protein [Niveispirillum sp. SYP-B3756]MQP68161.1 hypothetical protein [Niveispirillum sp. SYP-B3756]